MLTDTEFRVWCQMILSSDNFGVIPFSAALLRGANTALARHPEDVIHSAIHTISRISLYLDFEYQGETFLCDPVWQDFQKISRPSRTYYPCPPTHIFQKLSEKTREMFLEFHPNVSTDLRARGRAQARLTANGRGSSASTEEGGGEKPSARPFDRFWATYPRRVGKDDAERAWRKRGCDPLIDEILTAVEKQRVWLMRDDPRQGKRPGDLCPYPATWINRGGWKDEPPTFTGGPQSVASVTATAEQAAALIRSDLAKYEDPS